MAIVVFDPVAFRTRYPEFYRTTDQSSISDDYLTACFNEAGLYLSNTDCSPVQDITRRTLLLWMLTAHIAFVGGCFNNDGQPRPNGRLSQAAEGSVSAAFEGSLPGTGAWFQQSQYGAAFYQATSKLRGFRYVSRLLFVR